MQTTRVRGTLFNVNSHYVIGAVLIVVNRKPQFVTAYGSRHIERQTAARLLRHWRRMRGAE